MNLTADLALLWLAERVQRLGAWLVGVIKRRRMRGGRDGRY